MVHTSLSLVSSTSPFSASFPSTSPFSASFPSTFPKKLKVKATAKVLSRQLVIDNNDSPEKFLQNNSISDFVRLKEGTTTDDDGTEVKTFELQTAVVSYKKKFPESHLEPKLQVDLVSNIHIADKEYFDTLQKELEQYDRVLYEMVTESLESEDSTESLQSGASTESLESGASTESLKSGASTESLQSGTSTESLESGASTENSKSGGFNITGFIQRLIARFLTVDFQLDSLDYDGENWYRADLDLETIELLQAEKGESFLTLARDMTLRAKALVQPTAPEDLGPWRSKLLWASRELPMPLVFRFIIGSVCADVKSQSSAFPELVALSRLDFGSALKVFMAKQLTSSGYTKVTADVEAESVIVGERNKAAMYKLQCVLDDGDNKIAILYGCGHMPDLARRLREEFDLVPYQVQWITAWSIRSQNRAASSLPFLKQMAEVSGWPLSGNQTLNLLIFSFVLALDLLLWVLFLGFAAKRWDLLLCVLFLGFGGKWDLLPWVLLLGFAAKWIPHVVSVIFHYLRRS